MEDRKESARAINEKEIEEHRRLEYLDYQARNNFPDWDKFKRAWVNNLLHDDKELCDLYMGKTLLTNPLDVRFNIVHTYLNSIRENNLDPMQAFSVVLKAFAEYVDAVNQRNNL